MSIAKGKNRHKESLAPFLFAFLFLGFIILHGCSSTGNKKTGPEAEVYRLEIQRVIDDHRQLSRDRNEALKQSKGTRGEASRVYAKYAQGLRSVDATECPVDFQTAFIEYIHSIEDVTSKMAKEPPGVGWGTLLKLIDFNPVNILKAIWEIGGNEREDGIVKEVEASIAKSKERWRKVELIAVQYRVRL